MIDFIRMNYRDKSEVEEFICDEHNFPELSGTLKIHTGEVTYPFYDKLGNIEIKITDSRICLKNSIHKLNNLRKIGVEHNYNDFTYSELVDNIDFISRLPKIEKSRLSQLEFGLNIEIDTPAQFIIDNNIIMHNYKIHSVDNNFKGNGKYKQFNHSNYYVKVYDKAKHYKVQKNILRFEIKHKNSKNFNFYGIYNILDLKDKNKLEILYENLLKRFDEMTIIDNYKDNKKIPKKVKNQIERYTSFNYWEEFPNRMKKLREKKKFEGILNKYNLLTIKTELRNKLEEKYQYLINN